MNPSANGGISGGPSDEQIARELLDLCKLLTAARSSFDGAHELQQSAESCLGRVEDARRALGEQVGRAVAAEGECVAHHEAVTRLRDEVSGKVDEARSTLDRLDQFGGPSGFARLREEIEGLLRLSATLQTDFQQARDLRDASGEALARAEDLLRQAEGHASTSQEMAGEFRDVLAPIGGAPGLRSKLAKVDALEAAARKRLLGHDRELQELRDSVAPLARSVRRLKFTAWALSAAVAAVAAGLAVALLR
jgi:hypothetical protein